MLSKSLTLAALVLLCISIKASWCSPTSSRRCGDTIRASSGTISYKVFQTVIPNERCVWIVRAPNATSYSVTLIDLDIPNSVVITGFGYKDNMVSPKISVGTAVTVNASSILMVTFSTDSVTKSGRGFSLKFYALTNGTNRRATNQSEDVMVPANFGYIKFPSTRSLYADNELSTLVLTPVLGTHNGFKTTDVVYVRGDTEGCYDTVSVFLFDMNANGLEKWKFRGHMCHDVPFEVINNKDLILILFQTDGSRTRSGFHLYSRVLS